MPIWSHSYSNSRHGIDVTITTRSNLWGQRRWQKVHAVMGPDATDEAGDQVAEGESIYEGPLGGQPPVPTGTWIYRQRSKNGEWLVMDKPSWLDWWR